MGSRKFLRTSHTPESKGLSPGTNNFLEFLPIPTTFELSTKLSTVCRVAEGRISKGTAMIPNSRALPKILGPVSMPVSFDLELPTLAQ